MFWLINPCINKTKFYYYLHSYNYIKILNIKKFIIKNKETEEIIEYKVDYIDRKNKNYSLPWTNIIQKDIIKKDNHFYLEDFSVRDNYIKLKIEIDRLIKNRDKFKTIHFHLNNNGGGDIVPAHIIIRCLVGRKERWMRNIKKIIFNKEIIELDCWDEENIKNSYILDTKRSNLDNLPNSIYNNYPAIKKLNLDNFPNYNSKYNGKIFLHMDKQNGSAACFFITYLIYAFANKINRFSKKCYGQNIKYGTIESNNLILLGYSATTSGDGKPVEIKCGNIKIKVPTEQFISCSIKKNDWNRFWSI